MALLDDNDYNALLIADDTSVSLGSCKEFYRDLPDQILSTSSPRRGSSAIRTPPESLPVAESVAAPPPTVRKPIRSFFGPSAMSHDSHNTSVQTNACQTATTANLSLDTSQLDTTSNLSHDLSSPNAVLDNKMDDGIGRIQVALRLCPHQTQQYKLPTRKNRRGLHNNGGGTRLEDARVWKIVHHDSSSFGGATVQLKPNFSKKSAAAASAYTLDAVFDESTDTRCVYSKFCQPIVHCVADGRHGTILAYGRTGSGKTYTMQGNSSEQGVIVRAAKDLLQQVDQSDQDVCVLRAQYFEIYNEQVRDLLVEKPNDKGDVLKLPILHIMEEISGDVVVNAHEEAVNSINDVERMVRLGNLNRASAATDCNLQSSRSHAIFRLTLESQSGQVRRKSSLNLVDLAGSERGHTSGGVRLREGGKINQSLLSLSRVIHALNLSDKKRPKFIGYRDSKLTRILQPSLSGQACTAVLCCASASRSQLEETRNTLKFAASAKRIEVNAQVNETVDSSAIIASLREELSETKAAMEELRCKIELKGKGRTGAPFRVADDPSIAVSPLACGIFRRNGCDGSSASEATSAEESSASSEEASDASSEAVQGDGLEIVNPLFLSFSKSFDSEPRPPVPEVLVMRESQLCRYNADTADLLDDAEERANFLSNKLDATDNLVEKLFKDVKKANVVNEELHSLCSLLQNKVASLEDKRDANAEDNAIMMQQHLVLKYAIYAGLILYLTGQTEYFLAVVLFLWLVLEVFT